LVAGWTVRKGSGTVLLEIVLGDIPRHAVTSSLEIGSITREGSGTMLLEFALRQAGRKWNT